MPKKNENKNPDDQILIKRCVWSMRDQATEHVYLIMHILNLEDHDFIHPISENKELIQTSRHFLITTFDSYY